jgi:hypothetical protein
MKFILLCLITVVNALKLGNVVFYPIATTLRNRRLDTTKKLWIIRPTIHPEASTIHAYLGNGTFLVKSSYLAEFNDGEYAPYEPHHKYRSTMNTTRGIIIKCITTKSHLTMVTPIILSDTRFLVKGPVSMDVVHAIAKSQNVLWNAHTSLFANDQD